VKGCSSPARLRGVAAVAVAVALAAAAFASPSFAAIGEGDRAEVFSGPGLLGEQIDLAPLLGKQVIVLKFGSIYCSTCVQSIASFSDLAKKYPEDKLRVFEINLDIFGTSRVKKFYGGLQGMIHYPVLVDKNLAISNSYGVSSLPGVAIIGKDGKVAKLLKGYQESELEGVIQFIEDLAADRTPGKGPVQLGGGATEEGGFSLLLPTNFTKTQSQEVYVIGALPGPNGTVALTLNGGSKKVEATRKGFYAIRTPLSLGSNYIEVTGTNSKGQVATKAIVIFREPKVGKGIDVAFPQYRFHTADNEKKCKECHEVTPPPANQQNFQAITKMCGQCHRELERDTFIHGPITVGGCSPCHDFASQPARYVLFSQGTDLCFGCHQEKKDEFAKAYVHGPVAAGVCAVCHNPHGSNEKFQLRYAQAQLCGMCHQTIKEQEMRRVKHQPIEKGSCSACHDPHSSNNPKYFLRRYGDDLCYACHDERSQTAHKHPVGVVPVFAFPGIRLNDMGELVCLSCHNPHASEADRLLPQQGCPLCHTY
jgi:predicted CXXCH cytochrome family protein